MKKATNPKLKDLEVKSNEANQVAGGIEVNDIPNNRTSPGDLGFTTPVGPVRS